MVWHRSLPLMNSFNKTKAAIFSMQAMLPEGFSFSQWHFSFLNSILQITYSWFVPILDNPGVIPLATSTPGTISCFSFDVPLNIYYHFIGFILIFGWTRWSMKTMLTRERLSDWTARYNFSYRFSVADLKLF